MNKKISNFYKIAQSHKPHLNLPSDTPPPKWRMLHIDILLSLADELCYQSLKMNTITIHVEGHNCPLWGKSTCRNWGHQQHWALLPCILKACGSYVITFFNWILILECYMTKLINKTNTKTHTYSNLLDYVCLQKASHGLQSPFQGNSYNYGGDLCNHLKKTKFFNLISYNFCILDPMLKLGIIIYSICNC